MLADKKFTNFMIFSYSLMKITNFMFAKIAGFHSFIDGPTSNLTQTSKACQFLQIFQNSQF